jgi:hypothetical protein
MTLESGDILSVETFDRGVVERRLVRVSGAIAEVTTEEEWNAAKRENRSPVCVGFPIKDVSRGRSRTAR